MKSSLYLVWQSYIDSELFVLGKLEKVEDGYTFLYFETAYEAEKIGCVLPFRSEVGEVLKFNVIPPFFINRLVRNRRDTKKDYNLDNFNINMGARNTDNFLVVPDNLLPTYLKTNKNNDLKSR